MLKQTIFVTRKEGQYSWSENRKNVKLRLERERWREKEGESVSSMSRGRDILKEGLARAIECEWHFESLDSDSHLVSQLRQIINIGWINAGSAQPDTHTPVPLPHCRDNSCDRYIESRPSSYLNPTVVRSGWVRFRHSEHVHRSDYWF